MESRDSNNRMTHFEPLDSKPAPSIWSRLFGRTTEEPQEKTKIKDPSPVMDTKPGSSESSADSSIAQPLPESAESTISSGPPSESRRTLSSVLNRMGLLAEQRGQASNPVPYRDTDFKQYWMPDERCKQCYECGERFTTFRRRHHCRICGQIFCSSCCNQEVPGKIMGYTGFLRVCSYCCEVVLKFAQNVTIDPTMLTSMVVPSSEDMDVDRRDTNEPGYLSPSRLKPRSTSSIDLTSGPAVTPFEQTPTTDLYCIEEASAQERQALLKDSSVLRDLWRCILEGIEFGSHRQMFKTYSQCLTGSQLVDWLVNKDKANTRDQAIVIGQALLDAGFLLSLTGYDKVFRDGFYLYGRAPDIDVQAPPARYSPQNYDEEVSVPLWFREITQDSGEDRDDRQKLVSTLTPQSQSDSIIYMDEPSTSTPEIARKQDAQREVMSITPFETSKTMPAAASTDSLKTESRGWVDTREMSESNGEKQAYEYIKSMQNDHFELLIRQLLARYHISTKWADHVISLIQDVVHRVQCRVKDQGDDMDIRRYVHIKTISGGVRNDCEVLSGIAFTKNVVHKGMMPEIYNPRVLLLRAPIEYQRVENKFSSLEPQILQEHEYLKNCVARISSLKPDILLVEKSVSRTAQEFILASHICLVAGVKPAVLERVARLTHGDIVTSIDGLVTRKSLGTCLKFKVRHFNESEGTTKTLVTFTGCPAHLGCTVLLRGGSQDELKRVKYILSFGLCAAYHLRLELSFLMDSLLIPRVAKPLSSGGAVFEISDRDERMAWDDVALTFEKCQEKSESGSGQLSGSVGQNSGCAGQSSENSNQVSNNADVAGSRDANELYSNIFEHDCANLDNRNVEDLSTTEGDSFQNCDSALSQTTGSVDQSSMNIDQSSMNVDQSFVNVDQSLDNNDQSWINVDKLSRQPDQSSINTDQSRVNVDQSLSSSSLKQPSSSTPLAAQGSSTPNASAEGSVSLLLRHKRSQSDDASRKEKKLRSSADVCDSVEIRDGSDPLLSYQRLRDETIFQATEQLLVQDVSSPHHLNFRKVLRGAVLSVSPLQTFKAPYLESEAGCRCPLRRYFPEVLYQSEGLESKLTKKSANVLPDGMSNKLPRLNHAFVVNPLSKPKSSKSMQKLVADFRARGGTGFPPAPQRSPEAPATPPHRAAVEVDSSDCLHPENHQHLKVLFTSFLVEGGCTSYICTYPWVVPMSFYSRMDIAFGTFLERFCFNESYRCPNKGCSGPATAHVRRFAHNQGCVSVILKKMDKPLPDIADTILTWEYCKKCRQPTAIMPMSLDTWHMSFAKYLELRFYGDQYVRRDTACGHIFNQDYFQYFGINSTVASFKYDTVVLNEVVLPNILVLMTPPDVQYQALEDHLVNAHHRLTEIFSSIMDILNKTQCETQNHSIKSGIDDLNCELEDEKCALIRKMESVGQMLNSLKVTESAQTQMTLTFAIEDHLVDVKRDLAKTVVIWNEKISDMDSSSRKTQRSSKVTSSDLDSRVDSETSQTQSVPVKTLESRKPTESGSLCGMDQFNPDHFSFEKSQYSSTSEVSSSSSPGTQSKPVSEGSEEPDIMVDKKQSVKTIFSNLLRTGGVDQINSPFLGEEHHLLPNCQVLPVLVNDQQPSSIIAYTLSSLDYEVKLAQLQNIDANSQLGQGGQETSASRKGSEFKDKAQAVLYTATVDTQDDDDVDSLPAKVKDTTVPSSHLDIQFQDSSTKFYCRIYFAEEFRKLRSLIFPEGESRYIRSLSQCYTWMAKGGKSGSSFCKTQDGRFILKQMSRPEVESFTRDFGPKYFEYVTNAFELQRPTTLAKILGVYNIGFRNSQTNAALKQHLLVMENLFYQQTVVKVFDLKGSLRNRLVSTSGKTVDEVTVLLDENLLKSSTDNPLYLRAHSKAALTQAINNDTQLLSTSLVMDYSLLVGIDSTNHQLIVGIIDYIRTFTWDKRLETSVKRIAGPGSQPTVISPELYRRRFLDAMDKYFLCVPDRWYGLGKEATPTNRIVAN